MEPQIERIHKAAEYIKARTGNLRPVAGIVLGSGLGRLADSISDAIVIPYAEIPDFPRSTAIGHKGNFLIGNLSGKTVIAMQGRFHYYEGYDMSSVTLPVRVMKLLGIEYLFVSNASGACNPEYRIGDLILIKDHISAFPNPLIGKNLGEFGPRFPDMSCAYDPRLRRTAMETAAASGIELKEGVYFGSPGPTYETPAEVRFYRLIGADLLGMSTIPEVIVARHCGIRVMGISVVTNCANTDNEDYVPNDSQDVVLQADRAAVRMSILLAEIISKL